MVKFYKFVPNNRQFFKNVGESRFKDHFFLVSIKFLKKNNFLWSKNQCLKFEINQYEKKSFSAIQFEKKRKFCMNFQKTVHVV